MQACCMGMGTPEEQAHQEQLQTRRAAQISEAKRHANIYKPPEGLSMWASSLQIGCHIGIGMGLYFQMLEWLMILFSCITFLSLPFWIVINQSVFTDEANKDNESVGLKVFEKSSLLGTTFASIPDHQLDPNNTLTFINTKLGSSWYGPMDKDDFLLWISLLDIVGVVTAIFLVTYFTWKAGWFELAVDRNTFDCTDYTVLVTGLPPDAGFHEVGHFFSRFGEVMDVTLVLDMERVLTACAKASKLEHKREQQSALIRMFASEAAKDLQDQLNKTEDALVKVLKEIDDDMDRTIAERQHPHFMDLLRHPSTLLHPERWGSVTPKIHENETFAAINEVSPQMQPGDAADDETTPDKASQGLNGRGELKLSKKAVYDTKAAFLTFNRMSEAEACLRYTPNPGFIGWLYRHTVAKDAQCIRGYCIKTVRATNPTDYIFENMCFPATLRFWRKMGIYLLYLVLLIICALIISALSTRTRVDFDRTELVLSTDNMNTDIGRAASLLPSSTPPGSVVSELRGLYEQAMQRAASSATTPPFSKDLASQANFTDYCTLALPDVCAEHYRQAFGGAEDVQLQMSFGQQLQWGKHFDRVVYERPLLNSLNELAGATSPRLVKGEDVGLSACLACYCLGLSEKDASKQKSGAWLATSEQHCFTYSSSTVDSGTEAGISVVIAVINVTLKLVVQFLAAQEKQWTRSEMEKSFCIVAYVSQLLNSVLVVLLVNARPNARSTETGERVDEDDIQWLRYIILGGSFDDFSAAWYEYVGTSFMILLFIQTIFPLVNVLIEVVLKASTRLIVWCKKEATQDEYNNAYNQPEFLLQQRVADVMLNVSVALLFCSGMPLCAAVVVLVFGVASLMDRWAVTHLMTVCRYGAQLPRLILGLLPWAVFLHCGFGLWMHSYFMMKNWDREATAVFIQTGQEELQRDVVGQNHFGQHTSKRTVGTRISQPNAFGLLLLAFIMFLWLFFRHAIQRWLQPVLVMWIDGKERENTQDGGRNEGKCFWILKKLLDVPKIKIPGMPELPEDDDEMTFEKTLSSGLLKGLPTYRLPFHPRYADAFSGLLHSAIWSKMMGPYRYTRLVPIREKEQLTVYRVEVKTSDVWGAGTDADILLEITGLKDGKEVSTGLHELMSARNDFERGNKDIFVLTVKDVGMITGVEVRSCGKGWFGTGRWHLEYVQVTDCLRGVSKMFPCGKWLDPKWPESLVQVLTLDGDTQDQHTAVHIEDGAQRGDLIGGASSVGDGGHDSSCACAGPSDRPIASELPVAGNTLGTHGICLEETGLEDAMGETRDELAASCEDGRPQASHKRGSQLGLSAGLANNCGTLNKQRCLVQVKTSWRVTEQLILHAKDASLDENASKDFREYGYGPNLASYVASMKAFKPQRT